MRTTAHPLTRHPLSLRTLAAAALLLTLSGCAPGASHTPSPPTTTAASNAQATPAPPLDPSAETPPPEIIPLDISDCVDLDYTGHALDTWCSDPVARGEVKMACPDGQTAQTPTRIRTWTTPDGWGPWRLHTPPCTAGGPGTNDIADELTRQIAP